VIDESMHHAAKCILDGGDGIEVAAMTNRMFRGMHGVEGIWTQYAV
jgi:hypothetical protein